MVGIRDQRTQFWKRAIQIPFHQSLAAIRPVVSEKIKVYNVRRMPSDGKSSCGLWPGELKKHIYIRLKIKCYHFITLSANPFEFSVHLTCFIQEIIKLGQIFLNKRENFIRNLMKKIKFKTFTPYCDRYQTKTRKHPFWLIGVSCLQMGGARIPKSFPTFILCQGSM